MLLVERVPPERIHPRQERSDDGPFACTEYEVKTAKERFSNQSFDLGQYS
jgi:hypothetical protein